MTHYSHTANHRENHRSEYLHLKEAAFRLKRALDVDVPFNFQAHLESGNALLTGEGNLSFAISLLRKSPTSGSHVTATTFEAESSWAGQTTKNARTLRQYGASVRGAIDATRLCDHFGSKIFKLIIFQFPNVASRVPRYGRNPNHILIRHFLRSASLQLAPSGRVAITVVNSAYYDGAFDMDGAAQNSGFEKPTAFPFRLRDFPDYSHVNTRNDGSAVEKNADCVTCVFKFQDRYIREN